MVTLNKIAKIREIVGPRDLIRPEPHQIDHFLLHDLLDLAEEALRKQKEE